MKILHVGATDCAGGASRASYRLHRALIDDGVDSRMLVRRKYSDDPTVETSGGGRCLQSGLEKIAPPLERGLRRFSGNPTGSMWTFGFVPSRLATIINSSDADIVHLHWLGAGYMPLWSLSKIQRPIVWTLHDLWPILGVGHYDDTIQESGGGIFRVDWERFVERWKRKNWGAVSLSVVAPSPWVIEELLRRRGRISWTGHVAPYGLDTNTFRPTDSGRLRSVLGVSEHRPILVFGALGATSDKRKGADLLEKTLEELAKRRSDLQLIVFGDRPEDPINSHGFEIFRMGSINSDERLAEIYSLGDVFLFTSREETFGQTASESLACGTPVVGFRAAGQQSVYQHLEHGYLAEAYCTDDMANGIEWVISEYSKGRDWVGECRDFACERYSLQKYARSYQSIYKQLL
ncbi:glycosyltransferase [Akkermansiaceae bacterium]|nr:glycosyltransferase [Akkermansiaceae bacterium]MDB4387608.1 glycosyltransferase [Akkermansiaceae bacterium]